MMIISLIRVLRGDAAQLRPRPGLGDVPSNNTKNNNNNNIIISIIITIIIKINMYIYIYITLLLSSLLLVSLQTTCLRSRCPQHIYIYIYVYMYSGPVCIYKIPVLETCLGGTQTGPYVISSNGNKSKDGNNNNNNKHDNNNSNNDKSKYYVWGNTNRVVLNRVVSKGPLSPCKPICKSGFWEQPSLIRPRLHASECPTNISWRRRFINDSKT